MLDSFRLELSFESTWIRKRHGGRRREGERVTSHVDFYFSRGEESWGTLHSWLTYESNPKIRWWVRRWKLWPQYLYILRENCLQNRNLACLGWCLFCLAATSSCSFPPKRLTSPISVQLVLTKLISLLLAAFLLPLSFSLSSSVSRSALLFKPLWGPAPFDWASSLRISKSFLTLRSSTPLNQILLSVKRWANSWPKSLKVELELFEELDHFSLIQFKRDRGGGENAWGGNFLFGIWVPIWSNPAGSEDGSAGELGEVVRLILPGIVEGRVWHEETKRSNRVWTTSAHKKEESERERRGSALGMKRAPFVLIFHLSTHLQRLQCELSSLPPNLK